MLISFIDKTYESSLRKNLEDTKVAIGMLFIDNYEDTLQGLDEIQKAEVTSVLTKEIRSWARENKGVLARLDKDKYAIFIEKKYWELYNESDQWETELSAMHKKINESYFYRIFTSMFAVCLVFVLIMGFVTGGVFYGLYETNLKESRQLQRGSAHP